MKVAVLGGGAWGTVLASLAVGRGHEVALWEVDAAEAARLTRERVGARTVPGFKLPDGVSVTNEVGAAVADRELVVVVVPSDAVRATMAAAAPALRAGVTVVCASKGLEPQTRQTMAAVIGAAVPDARVALLSGPSFAQEIAAGLPAALVTASADSSANEMIVAALGGERFRLYTSDDVVGVAIGGALKNVIAIAVGCSDGFGFGLNARAALMTRGLAEMGRLAVRLGAHPLTLAGLAGFGDLVLTCTGELSRNRQVGLALARGERVADIVRALGHVAEGVGTARTAAALADELGVDLPITRAVAEVLHEGKTAREAVTDLLARDAGQERR
jgi:glycerol-3-phosphate dehydrogenase (NAD(P)+)